jgi:hypothetical protein
MGFNYLCVLYDTYIPVYALLAIKSRYIAALLRFKQFIFSSHILPVRESRQHGLVCPRFGAPQTFQGTPSLGILGSPYKITCSSFLYLHTDKLEGFGEHGQGLWIRDDPVGLKHVKI